ncbi:MAG: hypothetical protein JWM16_2221 [Verrucomicrobiales bacterium]|nr:hypothetical protein [Verrucomicrobiales bacterium]
MFKRARAKSRQLKIRLTLVKPPPKSNGKVSSRINSFYAQWRLRHGWAFLLQELPVPPEKLLQVIWHHQRLLRDELKTVDGRRLRVLHPGFWNHEAGPDFQKAIVQFDGEAPQSGDVEIDMAPSGWRGHGHEKNPAYQKVLLHVVWEGAECNPRFPTLVLKPLLDAPIAELATWLTSEAAVGFPNALAGRCCAPLRGLGEEELLDLLRQAGLVRMFSKASQLQARARQAGWEQALWEGLFRALGFKHNVWPMLRLAELKPRLVPEKPRPGLLEIQARLLGAGGLLPKELTRTRSRTDHDVKTLWDIWWREREVYADCEMPKNLWRFAGLRPANHPERRLAAGAHWLAVNELPGRLQQWCTSKLSTTQAVQELEGSLQKDKDDFWSWHWTLRGKPMAKPQPLIGSTRVTDLAVNVILPWLWARAREGQNENLQETIEDRFLEWPAAEDNSVLKLARQRLLGSASEKLFKTSAPQQGLLQIVRDFCEHSDALCNNCRFPELVQQWWSKI